MGHTLKYTVQSPTYPQPTFDMYHSCVQASMYHMIFPTLHPFQLISVTSASLCALPRSFLYSLLQFYLDRLVCTNSAPLTAGFAVLTINCTSQRPPQHKPDPSVPRILSFCQRSSLRDKTQLPEVRDKLPRSSATTAGHIDCSALLLHTSEYKVAFQ